MKVGKQAYAITIALNTVGDVHAFVLVRPLEGVIPLRTNALSSAPAP